MKEYVLGKEGTPSISGKQEVLFDQDRIARMGRSSESTVSGGVLADAEDKPKFGSNEDMLTSESLSWWKHFLKGLRASFSGPFDLEREKKSGLQ